MEYRIGQIISGVDSYGRNNTYTNSTHNSKVSKAEKSRLVQNATNTEESLENYKARVREEIDKIPFHSSHKKDAETLVISDEAYQAMKDDPEYEQWVCMHIRENRSVDMSMMTNRADYLSGSDYEYIGATKEECWGQCYNEWDYSKDATSSLGKKSKKVDPFSDNIDYEKLWEQARLERNRIQEEHDEAYFSHKDELVRINQKLAARSYEKNLVYAE